MITIPNAEEIPQKNRDRITNALNNRDEKLVSYAEWDDNGGFKAFRCKLTGDILVTFDDDGHALRTKHYATVVLDLEDEDGQPIGHHETLVSERALPLKDADLDYLYSADLLQWHTEAPVDWKTFGDRIPKGYIDGFRRGKEKVDREVETPPTPKRNNTGIRRR